MCRPHRPPLPRAKPQAWVTASRFSTSQRVTRGLPILAPTGTPHTRGRVTSTALTGVFTHDPRCSQRGVQNSSREHGRCTTRTSGIRTDTACSSPCLQMPSPRSRQPSSRSAPSTTRKSQVGGTACAKCYPRVRPPLGRPGAPGSAGCAPFHEPRAPDFQRLPAWRPQTTHKRPTCREACALSLAWRGTREQQPLTLSHTGSHS